MPTTTPQGFARPRAPKPRQRRRWLVVTVIALVVLLLSTVALGAYFLRAERWSSATGRTPMELVRYAERRLQGHPKLQRVFLPALEAVRRRQEREPPAKLPTLGKGQQAQSLPAIRFDELGVPLPVSSSAPLAEPTRGNAVVVRTVAELRTAMAAAVPGQVITLAPGAYAVDSALEAARPGQASRPIVLTAAKPGSVQLVVKTVQAMVVSQPYWVFENLDWQGTCAQHDSCEHAYHVVGRARGTVIVNNRMRDFNAAIKVNGENAEWPDDGLLQFNTIDNTVPRSTDLPVSSIDLVGAHGWRVLDNLISGSIKSGGDRIAYGMCLKGAAERMQVERNLVVCSPAQVSRRGLRVGISLGCGTTGQTFCRDGRCAVETAASVVANNVVAHCNDFGIDLNRSRDPLVAHNTLVNTEGIDTRQGTKGARIVGNLIEGRIRTRDNAEAKIMDNLDLGRLDNVLAEPDALDLHWLEATDRSRATPETGFDFCGQRRPPMSPPGATVQPQCDKGR